MEEEGNWLEEVVEVGMEEEGKRQEVVEMQEVVEVEMEEGDNLVEVFACMEGWRGQLLAVRLAVVRQPSSLSGWWRLVEY